jgi:hypothetical protein
MITSTNSWAFQTASQEPGVETTNTPTDGSLDQWAVNSNTILSYLDADDTLSDGDYSPSSMDDSDGSAELTDYDTASDTELSSIDEFVAGKCCRITISLSAI